LPVSVADETRQNLAVRETGSGAQFRFVLPGPVVTTVELENCISAALSRVEKGDYLIASGSLPLGVANDAYRILAARAEEAGAYFALDCPASSLRASLGAGVSLIKPSFSEFTQLTGVSPADRSAALRAIDDLVAHEKTKAVALSLGRQGAWFVSRDIAIAATAPKVDVVSTVGAGDSFLAALVAKLAGGGTPAEALRLAVASGTAALLRPGAELCQQEDVNALSAAVAVEPLR
jgi:6-phosphofructokinase 2